LKSSSKLNMPTRFIAELLGRQIRLASDLCTTAVTRTEFGRSAIWKRHSDSGHGGGSLKASSRRTRRAARSEMALEVECVVDGGVNRQEALG
jgi:hypothetical protein